MKCIVVDPISLEILWRRYERHEARQAKKVAEMLKAVSVEICDADVQCTSAFITGSGATPIAAPLGARFVQEVNAVACAVERLHPEVNSVIELGGQDAKIILFKENPETGERQVISSMNDKCASGTGATIDKCVLKIGMSPEELSQLRFDSGKLHHVAAKCGVFAQTDIVNLLKAGVPSAEVMNSLADAIVMQNLSVLTRGNTLRSKVLLLGGPNTYLPFLQDSWRFRIPQIWKERGYAIESDALPREVIIVPNNAEFYAAYGAVIFGTQESETPSNYRGFDRLDDFIRHGRKATLSIAAGPPLLGADEDLEGIRRQYQIPNFSPAEFRSGTLVRGYVGLDGGSTSSKAVLIDKDGEILAKEYQLSRGNPLQDTKDILARFKRHVVEQKCTLEILGFGATGYAADVLERAVRADINIVETVAHMMSAKRYCGDDIDVICDIGGQDIKVLFIQNGDIKSFRLSNQCSAGNGMLLQAMADQFGVDIGRYADTAFKAKLTPVFSYGCAVFLDTDRVNFQKEGFTCEELFAGLAMVLPKNIWQYVVQIPRLAEFGRKYVLQGGTQYNLAAVKAQADYIKARVPDADVMVHPHCGEAGAIGAALETRRVVTQRGYSTFIGLDAAIELSYTTRTDETTRCSFCENHCSRTFIDTRAPDGEAARYIAGFSCEKGTVESKREVIALSKVRKRLKALYPNLVDYEANLAFRHHYDPLPQPEDGALVDQVMVKSSWFGAATRKSVRRPFARSSDAALDCRRKIRLGMPRALSIYTLAPFLRAYLESLGVERRNIVFSDETSEEQWIRGGRYNSIDPCFPAKVALAHIHNLLYRKQQRKPFDFIWFPCVTNLSSFVSHTLGASTCPIVAGTPRVAKAAFTKEKDYFAGFGIQYVDDPLHFDDPELMADQLFATWGERLGVTEAESDWACEQGRRAMDAIDEELEQRARELLSLAEKEHDVVLLLLGRPYHNDPGLNHGVLDEFQTLGYPILSIRSIPKDRAYLERFFQRDLERGLIEDVFDIRDVWPENYSTNSAQKVWAAKFAARHPNVGTIDLSSFKCGQDAPTYGIVDKIVATSRTPHLALHDIDANKPGGSIRIRVKTYAYSLERYREHLRNMAAKSDELNRSMAVKRRVLVAKYAELRQRNANCPSPSVACVY